MQTNKMVITHNIVINFCPKGKKLNKAHFKQKLMLKLKKKKKKQQLTVPNGNKNQLK